MNFYCKMQLGAFQKKVEQKVNEYQENSGNQSQNIDKVLVDTEGYNANYYVVTSPNWKSEVYNKQMIKDLVRNALVQEGVSYTMDGDLVTYKIWDFPSITTHCVSLFQNSIDEDGFTVREADIEDIQKASRENEDDYDTKNDFR